MIHEIKFLSQQTKIASNHLFSKQLKTSNRTNRLEVSFLLSSATRQLRYYRLHIIFLHLSSQPSLWVELGSLLAKLELEDIVGTHGT